MATFTALQPNTTKYSASCRAPSQSTQYPNFLKISVPTSLTLHNLYSNHIQICYPAHTHQFPELSFLSIHPHAEAQKCPPSNLLLPDTLFCVTETAVAMRCTYTTLCYDEFLTVPQTTVMVSPYTAVGICAALIAYLMIFRLTR